MRHRIAPTAATPPAPLNAPEVSQGLDADTGAATPRQPAAPRSRRSLMTGTMVAGAGIATGLVFGAQPAVAATGDDLVIGEANFASSATSLTNDGESSSAGDGLDVSAGQGNGVMGTTSANGMSGLSGVDESSGGGFGVSGNSEFGPGVKGTSFDATGVSGTSENGFGVTGSSSITAGVFGTSTNQSQAGVWGQDGTTSPATGVGVSGTSTNGTGVGGYSTGGIGVQAASSSGVALQVQGTAAFSHSGVVSVPAGKASVTVTLAGVTASSLVLVTLQKLSPVLPVWVTAAVPGAGSFTIYLSSPSLVALPVAWIVFEHAAASPFAAISHFRVPRELPARKPFQPRIPKQPPPTRFRPRLPLSFRRLAREVPPLAR